MFISQAAFTLGQGVDPGCERDVVLGDLDGDGGGGLIGLKFLSEGYFESVGGSVCIGVFCSFVALHLK